MFESSAVVFAWLSPGEELKQPLRAAFSSQMEQQALAKYGATGFLMHTLNNMSGTKCSTDCVVSLAVASHLQIDV